MSINELFKFDSSFKNIIIGTDEAGRGPAAGVVFAAAVYFPEPTNKLIKDLARLNDSKKLSKKLREELFNIIKCNTINEIICVEVEEIERINILNSSLKAMNLACQSVISRIQKKDNLLVLVDGNRLIKEFPYNQKTVVKGDSKSASIAAASILAKVSRDRYMDKLAEEFPQYLWDKNAGYLTKQHIEAIDKYGLTKYHRPSFLRKHFGDRDKGVKLI